MYVPKHFRAHELIPPQVYKDRGVKGWQLIDDRLLITLDTMRDRWGPMTINDYGYGGERQWSGLRTPESPWYTPYSQHTFGRAADIIFKQASVATVRKDILAHPEDYEHIVGLELDTDWLHIDVRNEHSLYTFTPS